MGPVHVSNWIWGLWEREELRIELVFGWGLRIELVFGWGNRKAPYAATENKGGRLNLGRKEDNFSRLTLRWEIQCMSLRFRRDSG